VTTFAGKQVTNEQIKATTGLLKFYRRFLGSDHERCKNPEQRFGNPMTRDEARDRLAFLVNVAINRKAGIPDVAGRKQESDYQAALWRECHEIRGHFARRRKLWGLNGRRFQTDILQARYGHLLTG
jgi:hypothetical protein